MLAAIDERHGSQQGRNAVYTSVTSAGGESAGVMELCLTEAVPGTGML